MKERKKKEVFLPDISLSSMSNNDVLNVPTFPFSNLLTLFLQLTSSRFPLSPLSPIRFRKTDASVPLPPTVPVQTVTLYLTTTEQDNIIQLHLNSSLYVAKQISVAQG